MIKLTNILNEIRVIGNISPKMLLDLAEELILASSDRNSPQDNFPIKYQNIMDDYHFYGEADGKVSIYNDDDLEIFFNDLSQSDRNELYKQFLALR